MTAPTWAGFSVSADWGQDTYWDAFVRYSGEYNGIKLAAVTGWSETNGCRGNQTAGQPFGFAGTSCVNSPDNAGLAVAPGAAAGLDATTVATRSGLNAISQAMWATGSPVSTSST